MKLLIASNNAHKVREIEEILSGYFDEMVTMREAGLDIDVAEDGATFRDNAVKKATEILAKSGFDATLADDTGLCVDALGGAPGIYSARYAGEHGNDAANNAKLLADLADKDDKSAAFVCTIACVLPDGREFFVEGKAEGVITHNASGNGGFGYDPIFLVPTLGKTFADLTAEEKNAISHRGKAVEAFAKRLGEFI